MCIRREEGYCSMEYFSEMTNGFGVSVSASTVSAIFGGIYCI